MMTNRKSAFGAWFKAQFGRIPSERRRVGLRKKYQNLKAAYEEAHLEYRMEDELHATWNDALKGWTARDRK